jgi:cytidine deaminase
MSKSEDKSRSRRPPTAGDLDRLVSAARAVRAHAYAPYSSYAVGAAVLTRRGGIHVGCNVENSTFGATLCAERSAIASMVAAGDGEPVACVVVTAGPRPAAPCGICRQVLAEFARDMKVVLVAEDDRGRVVGQSTERLAALLPHTFRLKQTAARATGMR